MAARSGDATLLFPQELVNLLLSGVAVSNVFNGVMELDSGGAENVVCRRENRVAQC